MEGKGAELGVSECQNGCVLKKSFREWYADGDWFGDTVNTASRLEALAVFDKDTCEETIRAFADELEIKPGILINGARTVLTGRLAGPSMFDVLETLGRETVVSRLKKIDQLFHSFGALPYLCSQKDHQ